jgi:hypothetical protein
MIPGWTAGQIMPHRWRGSASGDGRGGMTGNLRFGLASISARFVGAGSTRFLQPGIPQLQATAAFVGEGRLLDLVGATDPYTASAVHFDGSTWLQRHAWLTGVGDFNKFIFSVWIKLSNAGDGLFAASAAASDFFQQGETTVAGTKYFNMNIADSYFDTYPNTPGMESVSFQHILWSTDVSGADGTSGGIVRQIYVNGSNIASTDDDSPGTDPTVSNLTDFYFADDSFGTRITGDIADFQMWIGTALDLSITANRELFIRDSAPVNPIIASQTLGTPTILFKGNATTFATNQGSGGTFTLHGSLTTVSGPSPAPYSATLPGTGQCVTNAKLRLKTSNVFAGTGSLACNATIAAATTTHSGTATLIGSGLLSITFSAYNLFSNKALNAGAPLTGSDATNYRNLLDGLTTDGLINADGTSNYFDALYVLAAPSSTVALLNLIGNSYNLTANGSPSFTAYQGYTGSAGSTTVFLNTGFAPSVAAGKYAQNSAHLSVWCNNNVAAQFGAAIGSVNAGNANSSQIFPRHTDNKAYWRTNDPASPSAGVTVADTVGFYVGTRSGASAQNAYKNATDQGMSSTTSAALSNITFDLLAQNVNGSHQTGYGGQISAASIGANLSGPQVTLLYNRLATYRTAVGL